jgi:predicted secreted protein
MKKIFLFTLTILFAAGASAFAADIPDDVSSLTAGNSAVEKTGASGSLSTMELYGGQDAVLKMKADKDAGYAWEIAEPWDEKVLEFIGKESLSSAEKGGLGTEVWTFKALKPGQVDLSFRYADSEGVTSPGARNAVFTIKVKEGAAVKSGLSLEQPAPYTLSGTVTSIDFSDLGRVNPLMTVKKADGEVVDFDVKPLCYVYGTTGQVSASEIMKGARVTVNYRINTKGGKEAAAIKIESL